jgi:CspA family cold shock protein
MLLSLVRGAALARPAARLPLLQVARAAALSSSAAPEVKKGTVKWFNATKGYGFIQPNEAAGTNGDVFVHYSAIEPTRDNDFRTLMDSEPVEFTLTEDKGGRLTAASVKRTDPQPQQPQRDFQRREFNNDRPPREYNDRRQGGGRDYNDRRDGGRDNRQ